LKVADIRCRHCVSKLQRRHSDHKILERNHDSLPFGFAVDPGRPAGNVERQRINGNGGEEVLEKLPPTIGLRRILGAPDAMLQFDLH
jgi:hypothetical protein